MRVTLRRRLEELETRTRPGERTIEELITEIEKDGGPQPHIRALVQAFTSLEDSDRQEDHESMREIMRELFAELRKLGERPLK